MGICLARKVGMEALCVDPHTELRIHTALDSGSFSLAAVLH